MQKQHIKSLLLCGPYNFALVILLLTENLRKIKCGLEIVFRHVLAVRIINSIIHFNQKLKKMELI